MVRTPSMETSIRGLRRDEAGRASLLLASAFVDDPFIGWFLRDGRRRTLAFPHFFRSVLHELLPGGAVYVIEAEGDLRGVAAWSPPDGAVPAGAARLLARLAELELRALFPRAAPRMLGGFAALGEQHPAAPHWYLAFVGIDPRWQGLGLGRLLLEPALARADDDGVACYLETPFPDTRRFYSGLGFVETEQLRPVAAAPPIWTMTRPAAPAR